MTTEPKDGRIYSWLRRHAWLIALAVPAVAGIGTWVNAVYKPFPPAPITSPTAASTTSPPLDAEAQKRADRLARATALHKLEVEKHPEATSFLFADYEAPDTGQFRGWVYIYAATKNHFVETDRQSCSYPDGSHVVVDFEQRTMLVSCDFPDFLSLPDETDMPISTGVVVVRFFDNDQKVAGTYACSCQHLNMSNAVFDKANRTLDVTIASGLEFGGGPSARIMIQRNEDEYYVRTRTTYDENWDAVGFTRVR